MWTGLDSFRTALQEGVQEFSDSALTEVRDGFIDSEEPEAEASQSKSQTRASSVKSDVGVERTHSQGAGVRWDSRREGRTFSHVVAEALPANKSPKPASAAPALFPRADGHTQSSNDAKSSSSGNGADRSAHVAQAAMAAPSAPGETQSIVAQIVAGSGADSTVTKARQAPSDIDRHVGSSTPKLAQRPASADIPDADTSALSYERLKIECEEAQAATRGARADLAASRVTIAELKAELSDMNEHALAGAEVQGMRAQVQSALAKVRAAIDAKEAAEAEAQAAREHVAAAETTAAMQVADAQRRAHSAEEAQRAAESQAQVRASAVSCVLPPFYYACAADIQLHTLPMTCHGETRCARPAPRRRFSPAW